jgi:hypothetical protein
MESQKFNVVMANSELLRFTAEVYDEESGVKETTIKGFTDLIVSVGPHNSSTWDSVRFIIELKSPPIFSTITSNFEGPKNQVFAELLGLKTKFDTNNMNTKIPKACLTDGFAIYICFLYNDVYYISQHTVEPQDYINALLFQLCDINAEELDKLIKKSEVEVTGEEYNEEDNEVEKDNEEENNLHEKRGDSIAKNSNNHKNNDDKSSKRPRLVINFNFEDEVEQYQDKLAYITKLENRIWGYAHMDEESLQNCVSNNGQNTSDYVMSKFLSNI